MSVIYDENVINILKQVVDLSKHNDEAKKLIQSIYLEYEEIQKDRQASAKSVDGLSTITHLK